MKLLKKSFEKDNSGYCTLIPEESEDLWHLYNLVLKDDRVQANTVLKIQKESATGTVATETRKLLLTIEVKQVEYDAAGNCIRFSRKNCEENQFVKLGAHHTIEIEINNKVTVTKDCWDFIYLRLLEEATDIHKSAEVGVILIEAGVANFHLLTSVLAKDVHRVTQTLPRKRLTTTGYDKSLARFFEQVYQGVKDHMDLSMVRCVVLAGPGFVKDDFLAFMMDRAVKNQDTEIMQKKSSFVLAHASCVHRAALKELLMDEQVQKSIANTKAAEHLKALETFYTMIKSDPERVCYGHLQVKEAVEKGAIGTLMVADSLFRSVSVAARKQFVEMAEAVREQGGTVHVFSSQHVSGQQLAQLGGTAAVLRFPMPELDDIDSEAGMDDGEPEAAGPPAGKGDDEDPFGF